MTRPGALARVDGRMRPFSDASALFLCLFSEFSLDAGVYPVSKDPFFGSLILFCSECSLPPFSRCTPHRCPILFRLRLL